MQLKIQKNVYIELILTYKKALIYNVPPAILNSQFWVSGIRGEDLNVKISDVRCSTDDSRTLSDGKSSNGLCPDEIKLHKLFYILTCFNGLYIFPIISCLLLRTWLMKVSWTTLLEKRKKRKSMFRCSFTSPLIKKKRYSNK
jgi:hypothetical protein